MARQAKDPQKTYVAKKSLDLTAAGRMLKEHPDQQLLLLLPGYTVIADIDLALPGPGRETITLGGREQPNLALIKSQKLALAESFGGNAEFEHAATFHLLNCRVFKGGLSKPVMTLDQMVLFADQVLGFTLVPRQESAPPHNKAPGGVG